MVMVSLLNIFYHSKFMIFISTEFQMLSDSFQPPLYLPQISRSEELWKAISQLENVSLLAWMLWPVLQFWETMWAIQPSHRLEPPPNIPDTALVAVVLFAFSPQVGRASTSQPAHATYA
jgi:hypothetical protein